MAVQRGEGVEVYVDTSHAVRKPAPDMEPVAALVAKRAVLKEL